MASALEPQLQSVLEDPRSATSADVPRAGEESAADSVEPPEVVRHDEVRPVEEVEGLDTQLQAHALADLEVLGNRQVRSEQARPVQNVAARRSQRKGPVRAEHVRASFGVGIHAARHVDKGTGVVERVVDPALDAQRGIIRLRAVRDPMGPL